MCEVKEGKVKYGKILRKAKKYHADYIIADEKASEFTDFSRLEKYNCYTPRNLIYDNLHIILARYFELYGYGKKKITLGIISEELKFLNKIEKFSDVLKSVYVFGCKRGEVYADEFYRNTGVAVVIRSLLERQECDFVIKFSEGGSGKNVVDFSCFGDFSRECEENAKILIKYILKMLKKT